MTDNSFSEHQRKAAKARWAKLNKKERQQATEAARDAYLKKHPPRKPPKKPPS